LQTKLSKVQAAMAAQDWPRAFSIASKFARLGPQRAAIMRAQAARLSPGLYRQMGRDPAVVIEEGKAAMRARFEAMR
jgi:hypothetical protein